jgi:DNA-binding CsgD family transcriptional regulator
MTDSIRLRADLESVAEVVESVDDADVILIDGDHDQDLSEFDTPVILLAADGPPASPNVLPRNAPIEKIAAAINAAAAGLLVLDPVTQNSGEPLSAREIEVLRLVADGLSNKIIAWKLNISEHTVKFHVNQILSKMNAGSRTEAVMIGLRRGLIPL